MKKRFLVFTILLRSVAQLYGQVRTDWNQRNVIDCSLIHPPGHKPSTRTHCIHMYHVTYQLRLVLNAFFCSPLCVRIYDTVESYIAPFWFFLIRGVPWASSLSDESIDRFPRYECFYRGKDKPPIVLRVGKCCRCALKTWRKTRGQ